MKVFDAIKIAEEKLLNSGLSKKESSDDVEDILISILHLSKTDLFKIKKTEISDINKNIFFNAINQRLLKKPVQYITNKSIFCGYEFFVNESCLIPRIDSEVVVEQILEFIKNKQDLYCNKTIKIIDVCCGSGCIGLSIVKMICDKKIFKDLKPLNVELYLLDKSSVAMQVAKINAQKLCINATFIISDILINGLGNDLYDIIVCNPPYIKTQDIKNLDNEVKQFEPVIALDGGEDGLLFYKSLSTSIDKNIANGGSIFFEIGYNQGKKVEEIYKQLGFNVKIVKDYGKQDRCVILSK